MLLLISASFAYIGCACGFYAYLLASAQPMPKEFEVREVMLPTRKPATKKMPVFPRRHAA